MEETEQPASPEKNDEAVDKPEDLASASSDNFEEEFDEFQASRTQVITKADLMSLEDDDEGNLAVEYAEGKPMPEVQVGRAHECLEIRTPVEEFETYVRARIDTLTRLQEMDRVDLTLQALEAGKRVLARITGIQINP